MCVTTYVATGDDEVLEHLAQALALVLKRA